MTTSFHEGAAEQTLAADGAIASFSRNLFPSACMLIARRSKGRRYAANSIRLETLVYRFRKAKW